MVLRGSDHPVDQRARTLQAHPHVQRRQQRLADRRFGVLRVQRMLGPGCLHRVVQGQRLVEGHDLHEHFGTDPPLGPGLCRGGRRRPVGRFGLAHRQPARRPGAAPVRRVHVAGRVVAPHLSPQRVEELQIGLVGLHGGRSKVGVLQKAARRECRLQARAERGQRVVEIGQARGQPLPTGLRVAHVGHAIEHRAQRAVQPWQSLVFGVPGFVQALDVGQVEPALLRHMGVGIQRHIGNRVVLTHQVRRHLQLTLHHLQRLVAALVQFAVLVQALVR